LDFISRSLYYSKVSSGAINIQYLVVCPLHVNQTFIKLRADNKAEGKFSSIYLESEAVKYHPQTIHSESATHHKNKLKKSQ